ncbi:uncharacterized protein L969DRAFT_14389 [Mixia osmundae IAM 14324]|uniref:C2H2-type domain-containing protein n=1 Tax=Mixia osmundae (strain CBS 9802 / IAM 14324 / JCM 22182 / KY 12970) TaxID=764103 RepID=G7E030_MIXOS|nr:uncharacterized protein L969DRAFT_14389 [Mixia osmundae IAM 14324]KEI42183.1 hypothetical protein L969DRAFT_14389 [Mixia osmundae IAM 14324]GAA96190.1 hypothetical protein E5Q_02854 [Mixia osmundae IAM 14324]
MRRIQGLPTTVSRPTEADLANAVGALTNPKETPLCICTIPGCYRPFPDLTKLRTHRKVGHQRPDKTDGAFWSEVLCWAETKQAELRRLAALEQPAQPHRTQQPVYQQPMYPQPMVQESMQYDQQAIFQQQAYFNSMMMGGTALSPEQIQAQQQLQFMAMQMQMMMGTMPAQPHGYR